MISRKALVVANLIELVIALVTAVMMMKIASMYAFQSSLTDFSDSIDRVSQSQVPTGESTFLRIKRNEAIVGFSKQSSYVVIKDQGSVIARPDVSQCRGSACACLCRVPSKPEKVNEAGGISYDSYDCNPQECVKTKEIAGCSNLCDPDDVKQSCPYFCSGGFYFENILKDAHPNHDIYIEASGVQDGDYLAACEGYNREPGAGCITPEARNRMKVEAVADSILPKMIIDCSKVSTDNCLCGHWTFANDALLTKSSYRGYQIAITSTADETRITAFDLGQSSARSPKNPYNYTIIDKTIKLGLCEYDIANKKAAPFDSLLLTYDYLKAYVPPAKYTFPAIHEGGMGALAIMMEKGQVCLGINTNLNIDSQDNIIQSGSTLIPACVRSSREDYNY